jgi:hypothetical protein
MGITWSIFSGRRYDSYDMYVWTRVRSTLVIVFQSFSKEAYAYHQIGILHSRLALTLYPILSCYFSLCQGSGRTGGRLGEGYLCALLLSGRGLHVRTTVLRNR